MNIHEYQAKQIFKNYDINVPNGVVCENLEQVKSALENFNGFVIKAQIHAGGRGLGGGVKIAKDKAQALKIASDMLNSRLITPQTPKNGLLVNKIYIEETLKFEREFYLSLSFNRENECISLIISKQGGMSVEELAKNHPELIEKILIDPQIGLRTFHALRLKGFLNLDKDGFAKFLKILNKLYEIYTQKDAILVEINPLVIAESSKFYALDAKICFDDSALFRHPEILSLDDKTQNEASENEARAHHLNYIKLDGDIGCVVNGAGLAMASMDIINQLGAKAANFLDVGGGANSENIAQAFNIVLKDKNVKAIFVNIFGGIVRCDHVANGILKACEMHGDLVPIVVRFNGTNAALAIDMLKSSNLNIHASDDLLKGAQMAINLANLSKNLKADR